ncbi:MAG: class 1 fructose-bisphosphatase [Phycisphaerales bacterium]
MADAADSSSARPSDAPGGSGPLEPHAAVVRPMYTRDNLTSLQSHILSEEQKYPGATGDFSWILSAIALAGKTIANKVRRARIEDVLGDHGDTNVQGEQQQKLDIIANEIIVRCLGERANIAVLASEEEDEPMVLRSRDDGGRYCVLFDPLDGSSNLNYGVGVGTIFSVLRNDRRKPRDVPHYLQPGWRQAAAGYVLYGSSTVFVLTTGNGVDMFVLDQSIGAFVLVAGGLRIPSGHKVYSVNEAYTSSFPEPYQAFLRQCHEQGWSSRYIGSMVADIHRTLLQGGVFLYPPTKSHPGGKLRTMYEANPMAMIVEQAGGKAFAGTERILDIRPEALHERTSVVMGAAEHVDQMMGFLKAD